MQQQIIEEFKALEAGSAFISKNSLAFEQQYPKQFIAVKESELIATGVSFEEVLRKVKEKNLDPSSVLIEYIPDKGEIILY